jgi:hypothetical protein
MKLLALFGLFFIMLACSDQVNEVQLADLSAHNMKIIPEKPTSSDEIKLVVYNDCNYHKLSEIARNGQIIDIEKNFNGAMKWPCIIGNDTIAIGKLASGTYTVNYRLVDVVSSGSPVISFSFHLEVPR